MKRNPFSEKMYAVAYRKKEDGDLLFDASGQKNTFETINNTWRYWYADPMPFSYHGEYWLFVEKMDRLSRKACIAAARISRNRVGPFEDVLIEKHHLSYPMVFEKNGEIYMIPESTSNRSLCLYICRAFPNQWELKHVLASDVLYADTNVFFSEGRCFLITGEMDPHIGSKTKTLVFDAERIEDGILIPLNEGETPSFSYQDRGAGQIIERDGRLLRPTQCGDDSHYGRYMLIKEIQVNQNVLDEKIINTISPENVYVSGLSGICGVHTYGQIADLEIIDCQYNVICNPAVILAKIHRKLKTTKLR